MDEERKFSNIPLNSIQHWLRPGMYNNPIIKPDAFLSTIKEEKKLHELAAHFEKWLNRDEKSDSLSITITSPCP